MTEISTNPLFGMLSTKELPSSGILKTNNNSIQEDHEKNSFLVKLINSIKSDHTLKGQIVTDIPSEKDNTTNTEDIHLLLKLLSMGTPSNIVTNSDGNQKTTGKEFTNAIVDNGPNVNTSTPRIESKTLRENIIIKNQELKPLNEQVTNLLNNLQKTDGESNHEQPAPSISSKLITMRDTTNSPQEIIDKMNQGQSETSFPEKLSSKQNNTKMIEQRMLDVINRTSLRGPSTDSTENKSVILPSKLPGMQDPGQQKGTVTKKNIVKAQTTTRITGDRNTAPTIKKTVTNTTPDTYKILSNRTTNPNTSSHTEKSDLDKIHKMIKVQHPDKSSLANTSKNPQTQQGPVRTKENGAPIIFDVSANTTDVKTVKSSDNTIFSTNSNSPNISEINVSVNTPSDNPFSNNQGTEPTYDFRTVTANVKQNTEQEKSFNNSLSQISNSNKSLGQLSNDITDNIIQSAKSYTQGGNSEIKIQLNPPELGTLKLEFSFEEDMLETKITVERPAVKDVIEKDIPRLKELISNSDIDVSKLDVALQEKEDGRMDFMNKEFHSGPESKEGHDFSNQEKGPYEENADDEKIVNNTESTQINYLV